MLSAGPALLLAEGCVVAAADKRRQMATCNLCRQCAAQERTRHCTTPGITTRQLWLTLSVQGGLASLVLGDLHHHVLLAPLAEGPLRLGNVHLRGSEAKARVSIAAPIWGPGRRGARGAARRQVLRGWGSLLCLLPWPVSAARTLRAPALPAPAKLQQIPEAALRTIFEVSFPTANLWARGERPTTAVR